MSALTGIRVLDLSRLLPGPYCTMLLSDMGAEVIRIEQPGPYQVPVLYQQELQNVAEDEREKLLTTYSFVNRNKRSISLNLKDSQAREIFYKLAKDSDVVVDEFRPGVTKRIGVDYDTLKKINPRIICCGVTAYGQYGPYTNRPSHDQNILSIVGIQAITGTRDGQFVRPGIQFADLAGGVAGALGVLYALVARQRTGEGQFVDASMTDIVFSWMMLIHGWRYMATGRHPKIGERLPHIYKTKDDKYLCVAVAEPHFWEGVCKALGLEECIPSRKYLIYYDENYETVARPIVEKLANAFLTKTRDEWLDIIGEMNVSPMYQTLDEVMSDPQLIARSMVVEMDHPTFGKLKQGGIPVKLSATPGEIKSFSPRRGQDTKEVLLTLGYSEAQIDSLKKQGVI